MSNFLRKNSNPSLLDLLKMGCVIEFDNGVKLVGDTVNNSIESFNMFGFVGLWNLNRDGLRDALSDKDLEMKGIFNND